MFSETSRHSVILEVCVDCVDSALNAVTGGARRLELCSALGEGGLTPTTGLLKAVKLILKDQPVPIMCLIRCRAGGFVYSSEEVALMKDDINALKEAGADGFVIGALKKDGAIDVDACLQLRAVCGELPVTFHRAFDYCKEPLLESLAKVKQVGCDRLLTSGREKDVVAGISTLADLCSAACAHGLIIMPGGGVRVENIPLLRERIQPLEIHMSASLELENIPGMGVRKVVESELVSRAVSAFK